MLLEKITCRVCEKEITKYSKSGLCSSCSAKERNKNPENNPNFKDGRSLKKYYCIDCNKEINWQTWFEGNKVCRSCASRIQLKNNNHLLGFDKSGKNNPMFGIHRFGKDNPNYKENKEFRSYPLGWNNTYKEQIRFRDNYTCQNCGVPEIECKVKLHVHHIDYCKTNLDPNNLVSLCHNCHAKTTVSKPEKIKFWVEYYKRI